MSADAIARNATARDATALDAMALDAKAWQYDVDDALSRADAAGLTAAWRDVPRKSRGSIAKARRLPYVRNAGNPTLTLLSCRFLLPSGASLRDYHELGRDPGVNVVRPSFGSCDRHLAFMLRDDDRVLRDRATGRKSEVIRKAT